MGEEFEVRGNGAFDADTIYDLLKGWWFLFFLFCFFPLPSPPSFRRGIEIVASVC